jgi:predicted transposase YdaD
MTWRLNFETHATEVVNMLLTEWNWDIAREVWQEESREEGREEGRNELLELMEQGYSAEQIRLKLAAVKSERVGTAGK